MNASKPHIVGLTGGIATGKSTARKHLVSLGACCIDTDALSHSLMEPGGAAVEPVRELFGDDIVQEDGSIDRKALGRIVFSDLAKRRQLEGIIHPVIQRITREKIREAGENGIPLVILDVPLLFESGMDVLCDETWVITLDARKQLMRLMERDNISEADALLRIESQMPQDEKIKRANVAISNDRTEDRLRSELTALYHSTLKRAEKERA